ncbi:alanine--tRNA ligase [Caldiplasma sukawensis]
MESQENDNVFNIKTFELIGFKRKKCTSCGKYFWTSDSERRTCGDPPCDSYTFIGNPAGKKQLRLDEARRLFIDFFSVDHGFLKPYPVIPRWREDVFLVNASIYVFQPHVTSGLVPPPANPLVMSQPSIRLNDIDSVGVTGRHLTSFEMLCHDSFNSDENEVYWIDGTVERCYRLLTDGMGIYGKEITFKENPWFGGGNAGNALEVFVRGLEVATLVFMDLVEDPEGEILLDGTRYTHMRNRIVDTGYGLERLSWVTLGSPTVYDAIFPEVVDWILEKANLHIKNREFMKEITEHYSTDGEYPESIVADLIKGGKITGKEQLNFIRDAYILADHTRTIFRILREYVIPSNAKLGYLVRLLLRRTFRAMKNLGLNVQDLLEAIKMHSESLKEISPGYDAEFFEKTINREFERYKISEENGRSEVLKILKKKHGLDEKDLEILYDSYGIVPEISVKVARENGITVRIPENFHEKIVNRHSKNAKENEESFYVPEFRDLETRTLYYDDPRLLEFSAIVLASKDNYVVLNQTAFYPTGGGQPNDFGYLQVGFKKYQVTEVFKQGNAIIHKIDGVLEQDTKVQGHVDGQRRKQLMIHHTSTHLLLGTLRKMYGKQVWQAGAQKNVDYSRLDVTIDRKIEREDVINIENECLKTIIENHTVTAKRLPWNAAVEKYGFILFQGGVPLSPYLRVVEIEGVDVEGCGGTHLSATGQIGFLKIISVENIQEGVVRFTFCAGPAALKHVEKQEDFLIKIKEIVKSPENTVEKLENIVKEWLEFGDKLKRMYQKNAEEKIENLLKEGDSDKFIELNEEDEEILKNIISICLRKKVDAVVHKGNELTVILGNGKSKKRIETQYGIKLDEKSKVTVVSK